MKDSTTAAFDEASVVRQQGRFAVQNMNHPEGSLTESDADRQEPGVAFHTYMGYNYLPGQLIERLILEGRLSPGARGMTVADALDQLAAYEGVDRGSLESFDSDDFPKPSTWDQVTAEHHKLLGREYWDSPGYDGQPRTADEAFDGWVLENEINFRELARAKNPGISEDDLDVKEGDIGEDFFRDIDAAVTGEEKLAEVRLAIERFGLTDEQVGVPVPVRHN